MIATQEEERSAQLKLRSLLETIALAIGSATDISWSTLKARSLVRLGQDFGLSAAAMNMAGEQLAKRKDAMLEAINADKIAGTTMKNSLSKLVKKRWNGTFNLFGQALSRKR